MPVPADLLKALADDPKALEHQLGCMTGLFQIFDRPGLGRRYGSKRVSNAGSGQSQPNSACETPRHDHRSNNPYWMFEDDASQRISGKNGAVVELQHHRACSDSSEIFTKSFETPTESRTSPDEKSQQLDHSPRCSEESVGGAAFGSSATSSYPIIDHEERHCHKLTLNVVRNSTSKDTPTSDIRDVVRASFDHSRNPAELTNKPRLSVDGPSHSHPHVKNLPRSSSVDGRDNNRLRLSMDQNSSTARQVDLPRSSSVGGRGASRMLADWKDGLRSSSGSPRLTSKEKEILRQNAEVGKSQNSGEGRDATRLTVELKEGPRLSVDRRAADARATSPRMVPATDFKHSLRAPDIKDSLRAADVKDSLRGADVKDSLRATDFKESLRGADIKDSLRGAEIKESRRAADIKEFLRGSQRVAREEHRYSVDGTRDAPRASTAPRLSVDGREYSANSGSGGLAPRRLKLGSGGEALARQSSGRGDAEGETRRKASNVVARLMGLDELPRAKEADPLHEFLHSISPPPPPDENEYAHRPSDQDGLRHWQKRVGVDPDPITHHQFPSSTHHEFTTPTKLQQCEQQQPTALKLEPVKTQADQVQRKSPQGRRSLWHIFEAMQLKALLNGSSKKKQAEALRVHNLKITEERLECEEVKQRSQSLPPRLHSPASKDPEYLHDTPRVSSLNREIAHSIAMPEHKQRDHFEPDHEVVVVVKPIITRSVSYKAQTSAPPLPAATSPPSEALPNRGVSRAVVTEVILQEPVQGGDSSHQTSGSARQSRKEQGVRMTKSFSDVLDASSPRGLRAKTQLEKPPRSGSSSVSPRCPVEGVRVVDAGKVRRKQAVAVKDRDELTKASLANLRANATKQEFLKGRASGDPDTPRLLRRSSSESKLLSKIAEKPITPAPKPPPVGGRSAAPPNMALLRSKRPVAKDNNNNNNNNNNNKSPLKTRPTSVKSVAKLPSEHVNRPKPVCISEPATPKQSKSPAGAQRCTTTEVRATQGGALDHSGDTAHANAREQRSDSKAARGKPIEIEEGVKTPRGVSIKKIDFSEDAQAEVAEQPSPVSVLDNFHFDEELTPSPKAGKSSVVNLQEQSRNEKDRRWSSARFLDLDLEDNTATALLKVSESVKDAGVKKSEPVLEVEDSAYRHGLRVCLRDAEEERRYVEELVEASLLGSGCSSPDFLGNYVMDPSVFDQLETKRSHLDEEKDALDRRILFDCVNEVLERLLEAQVSWKGPSLRKRPMGRQLVKDVLVELGDIPCAASDDVSDVVYVILQKDLVKGRGQQWSDYTKELEEVGVAVERLIVKDLIEETVRELTSACFGQNPLASRRQLFA